MTSGIASMPAKAVSRAQMGMFRHVALEIRKGRRKHLGFIVVAVLVVEIVWFGCMASSQANATSDYRALLYGLPVMNAIFLPLLSSIVASTVCDIENHANMWKELLTMERASELFCAKWLTCAIVLGLTVMVEVVSLIALGGAFGYQPVPVGEFVVLWVSTLAVCLFVATIIQALCLFLPIQFVPIAVGVALSFLGLFCMYLPPAVMNLVPSAYFGLLSTVSMSYDETTQAITWLSEPWSVVHFIIIAGLTLAVLVVSVRAFSRKEF